MKKIISNVIISALFAVSAFAQNDLQPLAVVKLNKSETITLKQLKSRVTFFEKQYALKGNITVDQKKQILDTMISEKLVMQAATKEGIAVTDSQVNAAFLNNFSQQLGVQVTESQLSDIVKKNTGKTLDEYIKENSGMSVSDYKSYLKNQLTVQNYVYAKKQNELKNVSATDEEIRKAYDMNKASFVRSDTVKLFLVMIPKGNDVEASRSLAKNLRDEYSKSPASAAEIKSSADNGKKYSAGELIVVKNEQQAKMLGWSMDKMQELFDKKEKFISELTETNTDFQFYAILNKYDAKMLTLSDVVQPGTTVTVYDFIKGNLTSQKQSQFLAQSAVEISKALDTPANVDRKKTGDDLTKLLEW